MYMILIKYLMIITKIWLFQKLLMLYDERGIIL